MYARAARTLRQKAQHTARGYRRTRRTLAAQSCASPPTAWLGLCRLPRAVYHGDITLVGCLKLDGADYSDKRIRLLRENKIKRATVVRMESLCCGGSLGAEAQTGLPGKFYYAAGALCPCASGPFLWQGAADRPARCSSALYVSFFCAVRQKQMRPAKDKGGAHHYKGK